MTEKIREIDIRGLRVLAVLGQKPDMTGSGILVRELWDAAQRRGDRQYLICAGYSSDNYDLNFGESYSLIRFTKQTERGELPFPIPGMSDVMPYDSIRYGSMTPGQLNLFLGIFKSRLCQAISDFSPDVVHLHHLWTLTSLVGCCRALPVVVTIHGSDLKLLKSASRHEPLVRASISKLSHFMAVSHDMASEAVEIFNIPKTKMSVIGNGYNESVFKIDGPVIDISYPVVLCAGKFVHWKGFAYIIRACAAIKMAHRLVILGTGPVEERIRLMQLAEELGALESIFFPGHVSQTEVAKWMRSAKLFVLPSTKEPFGLVLLEALACGCPVVAANSGGPKDIVSKVLQFSGLAKLVPPVKEGEERDEARYVADLRDAVEGFLAMPISALQRRTVASTVKGMEWSEVYRHIREIYCRLVVDW